MLERLRRSIASIDKEIATWPYWKRWLLLMPTNPNDIATPGGNFNDQSIASKPNADPIDPQYLFLRECYTGADGKQIYTDQRVSHPEYGPGIVYSYFGENTVLKYVLVHFDSGYKQQVAPNTLTHL